MRRKNKEKRWFLVGQRRKKVFRSRMSFEGREEPSHTVFRWFKMIMKQWKIQKSWISTKNKFKIFKNSRLIWRRFGSEIISILDNISHNMKEFVKNLHLFYDPEFQKISQSFVFLGFVERVFLWIPEFTEFQKSSPERGEYRAHRHSSVLRKNAQIREKIHCNFFYRTQP